MIQPTTIALVPSNQRRTFLAAAGQQVSRPRALGAINVVPALPAPVSTTPWLLYGLIGLAGLAFVWGFMRRPSIEEGVRRVRRRSSKKVPLWGAVALVGGTAALTYVITKAAKA